MPTNTPARMVSSAYHVSARSSAADRQGHRKERPCAKPALHPDLTTMPLDDVIGEGKAEADSLADLLGGEEGVPDPVDHLGGDAGAGVPDLDGDRPVING